MKSLAQVLTILAAPFALWVCMAASVSGCGGTSTPSSTAERHQEASAQTRRLVSPVTKTEIEAIRMPNGMPCVITWKPMYKRGGGGVSCDWNWKSRGLENPR